MEYKLFYNRIYTKIVVEGNKTHLWNYSTMKYD